MKTITIFLIDDHTLFREGVKMLLSQKEGLLVIGESSSIQDALITIPKTKPDLIFLDLALPGESGIDAISLFKKHSPKSHVVVLSSHFEEATIKEVLEKGAEGYVSKNEAFQEIELAIKNVISGYRYLSPKVSDIIYSSYINSSQNNDKKNMSDILTDRERCILRLCCEGKYPKEIAAQLSISRKTVDIHKRNLKLKLGISSDAEMVRFAIANNLLLSDI